MTNLARLRADLRTFSLAVKQLLERWQAHSLALERRNTVLVAPRQSGKSRSLSVVALWWAYSRPGQIVLVVSAGEDASRSARSGCCGRDPKSAARRGISRAFPE